MTGNGWCGAMGVIGWRSGGEVTESWLMTDRVGYLWRTLERKTRGVARVTCGLVDGLTLVVMRGRAGVLVTGQNSGAVRSDGAGGRRIGWERVEVLSGAGLG